MGKTAKEIIEEEYGTNIDEYKDDVSFPLILLFGDFVQQRFCMGFLNKNNSFETLHSCNERYSVAN